MILTENHMGKALLLAKNLSDLKLRHYKIISLEALSLDVKNWFCSGNKRMYLGESRTVILGEGKIGWYYIVLNRKISNDENKALPF